jgi:NADPH:quinone reductase-like Zn-dependent oxidoreductase
MRRVGSRARNLRCGGAAALTEIPDGALIDVDPVAGEVRIVAEMWQESRAWETETMRAVVLRSHGGPESLTIECARPGRGPEDVVVAVRATALTRADLLQVMGMYPNPRPAALEIPGLEFSGTVQSVGDRVTMWKPGDAVMGIEAGGAYAERIATHERQLMRVPTVVGVEDGAAIPEVFLTAWDALVLQGGRPRVAGPGTCRCVRSRYGEHPDRHVDRCSHCSHVFDRQDGLVPLARRRSRAGTVACGMAHRCDGAVPDGFDTILDVVGGEEIERNLQAVAMKGRIIQVGLMGGSTVPVNVYALMGRRVSWTGTMLRARPIEEKIALTRRFAAEMLPLFDSGRLRPVIDSRFPFDQIADAHRHMAANANAGKIMVDIG